VCYRHPLCLQRLRERGRSTSATSTTSAAACPSAWFADPDGNNLVLQQLDWRTGDNLQPPQGGFPRGGSGGPAQRGARVGSVAALHGLAIVSLRKSLRRRVTVPNGAAG
jgi:hypothetical protein